MTELSDYRRLVERPFNEGQARKINALTAEVERLRLWIRRIENINDSPSCFNAEIDAACRAAWHGHPMRGKVNVQLPPLPAEG